MRKSQSRDQKSGEAEVAQDEEEGGDVPGLLHGAAADGILGEVVAENAVADDGTLASIDDDDHPHCHDVQWGDVLYAQNRVLVQSCHDDEEHRDR